MNTMTPDSPDEGPPEEFLNKLPPPEDYSAAFNAGGWSAVLGPDVLTEFDSAIGRKPEMVQRDDREAWEQGFR